MNERMSDVNDKFQSTNGLAFCVCVRESADVEIEMRVTFAHKRDRIQLRVNTQAHNLSYFLPVERNSVSISKMAVHRAGKLKKKKTINNHINRIMSSFGIVT